MSGTFPDPEYVIELLQELTCCHGVSGFEDDVRTCVERHLRGQVDELSVDALGNLVAVVNASTDSAPTLLLDAHMDEIGLVIAHVETDGALRFALVGGWDERLLPGQRVQLRTREGKFIDGVIGTPPPHIQRDEDRKKPYSAEALFIDIGARSRAEVDATGLRIGDSGVVWQPFQRLLPPYVTGKAFDDRVGCALLILLLRRLASEPRLPIHVVGLFSTFEEIGARGALAAAYRIAPDVALVLEGTVAADVPGVPEARCPSRIGGGPALTIMDRNTHCTPRLVRFIEEVADHAGIPWQHKRPIFGGSDAARIHTTRGGVPTAIVSVPCRYIHSSVSLMSLEDFAHTYALLEKTVWEMPRFLASAQNG
ncbi:Deblocking aminopeptidase [Candidatus Sumerlaea chitinivorans]|uniref:Deblocking aminopeptidase n=1 Tax=Sumerlaea chitinivorans TaxID=2250252 RepID=A0A2Z4Y7B0_SUMC1|nr:Deblocking aminopeptidase [Candidatus Sumerlaea chitinivorans]